MGKFFKILGVIFAIIILGIIAMFGYGYISKGDREKVADEFVAAMVSQQPAKAYEMMHKNTKLKISESGFNNLYISGGLNTISQVEWVGWNADFSTGVYTFSGTGKTTSGVNLLAEIEVTDKENDGKLGILSFNFEEDRFNLIEDK